MSSSGRDKLLLWVMNNPVTCKTSPKDMLPLTHCCTSLYPPSLFHTHNCHYCQVQTTVDSHCLKQGFLWHTTYTVAQWITEDDEQPFLDSLMVAKSVRQLVVQPPILFCQHLVTLLMPSTIPASLLGGPENAAVYYHYLFTKTWMNMKFPNSKFSN